MSNFAKLMQQAASGVAGGGGNYQTDANDSVTSLWLLNSVGGEFACGQNNKAKTIGVKSDHTAIVAHNDDSQVEFVEVATDGTVGTKLKLDVSQSTYAGLAIDPFDEDYIYLGGEIGTGGTQYIMKLQSDLSTTTPEWQKLITVDMGRITSFNPQFTEDYIYQFFDGYNMATQVNRLIRYDRDGGNVSAWDIEYDSGLISNIWSFAVSEDGQTLYYTGEPKLDDYIYVIAVNLQNNTKRWAKKIYNPSLQSSSLSIDNSDNGCVIAPYESSTNNSWLIKFAESDGTIEWQTQFGNNSHRYIFNTPHIKKNGSIAAIGGYREPSSVNEEAFMLTFDPSNGTFSSDMYVIDASVAGTTRYFGGNNLSYILGDRMYHSMYGYNSSAPNTFMAYTIKLDTTISSGDAANSVGTWPSGDADIEIQTTPALSLNSTWTTDTASLSMTSASTTGIMDSNSTITVSADTTETYYTENWRS